MANRIASNGTDEHKVLVVDDDKNLNLLIVKLLETKGYSAVGVFTGEEAIEHTRQNRNVLLLLDYSLPDINGREVIDRLACDDIRIPFIVMTGREMSGWQLR